MSFFLFVFFCKLGFVLKPAKQKNYICHAIIGGCDNIALVGNQCCHMAVKFIMSMQNLQSCKKHRTKGSRSRVPRRAKVLLARLYRPKPKSWTMLRLKIPRSEKSRRAKSL
jgi:hypothetical protein